MSDNNQNQTSESEKHKDSEKQYDLYTEKIVTSPWNKIRKALKHLAKVVGSAMIFGVVASLVMVLIYPNARKFIGEEETTTRQFVIIPTDSQTYDESTDSLESTHQAEENESQPAEGDTTEQPSQTETETEAESTDMDGYINEQMDKAFGSYKPGAVEFGTMYADLRKIIAEVNKSVVTVTVSVDGIDWFNTVYSDINEEFGVIIAEDDLNFYILTSYDVVRDANYIAATFNDGTMVISNFIMGDNTTGFAVISSPKAAFEGMWESYIKTAVLGNSYLVQQGDPLLLSGNIYGQLNTVVYGFAAATKNTLMDTDSNYRMIMTDVTYSQGNKGVVANLSGEVVGLITSQKDNLSTDVICAYGISELKTLIERMVNGMITPYAGVLLQSVTSAMQDAYSMPKGLYVSLVEADSPAYIAGIQSGDIITAVNDTSLATVREYQNALFALEPGMTASVLIQRPGRDGYREIEILIELGAE